MRAFFAIPLPACLRDELARTGRAVKGLKAQKAATLHLTLRFLGDIEDPEPFAAAAAEVAARHEPFAIGLAGTGVFPNERAPRVYWVGLAEGVEQATALAEDLEEAVVELGIPREYRQWRGHVTLGRFRKRPPRPPKIDPEAKFGTAPAETLVLYRSTLTPQGAVHDRLRELSLGHAR